jgi:hypothetical protein
MQITSSIEPIPALDQIVEAPGRHRRHRHEPRLSPIRQPPAAPLGSATLDGTTPLWTRHTLGAIEAGRDRRLQRRTSAPIRYRTAPRAEAVVVHVDFARERWVDDGGTFDRGATAALPVAIPRS